MTLALAGAATSAFLSGLSNAILLTDSAVFSTYRFWAVGSLSGRTVQVLLDLLPFLVVGFTPRDRAGTCVERAEPG